MLDILLRLPSLPPSGLGFLDAMQIQLLHPEHPAYPAPDDTAWAELGLWPVGQVRDAPDGEWMPLLLDERRAPYALVAGEPRPLDPDVVGPNLYLALDEAGESLWGHEWNSALGEVFGLNRRTTQRDRVSTNLLPPRILMTVAYLASIDDRREMAEALRTVARIARHYDNNKSSVRRTLDNALDIYFGHEDLTLGLAPAKAPGPR